MPVTLFCIEVLRDGAWRTEPIQFTKINAAKQHMRGLMVADPRIFFRKLKGHPAPLRKKDCYRIARSGPAVGDDFIPEAL